MHAPLASVANTEGSQAIRRRWSTIAVAWWPVLIIGMGLAGSVMWCSLMGWLVFKLLVLALN